VVAFAVASSEPGSAGRVDSVERSSVSFVESSALESVWVGRAALVGFGEVTVAIAAGSGWADPATEQAASGTINSAPSSETADDLNFTPGLTIGNIADAHSWKARTS
jgi:hypothetical protein